MRHTHEVLEKLQDLLSALQSIESSSPGFVLTGSDEYLDLFHAGILRVHQDETFLRNLTVDNPVQQRQFPILDRLLNQKIEFDEQIVGLRRTMGLEAAADAIRAGPSQRIVNEFQGVVREMQDEELRLLAPRNAYAKRRLGQTKTVLILETILGLLITAAAGWSVQRNSSGRGFTKGALR